MNRIQRILVTSMALILLGFLLYPEWTLSWTRRLEYRYYYDADLTTTGNAEPPWQTGFELERRHETRRHLILPPPQPRDEPLPVARSELTGTGAVNLGKRHTRYTGATVLNLSTSINKRKAAWETFVMLIPMGMFLIMFRDKPRKISLLQPFKNTPPLIRIAEPPPSPPGKPQAKPSSSGETPA